VDFRYYQAECIDAFFDYFATHETGNPVGALPTGTGKSLVIAGFLQRAFSMFRGQRMIMATHSKKLIRQNYDELLDLWPTAPAGIYSAGLKLRQVQPITFCGIQSVAKRAEIFGKVDIVIIDECHLVSPHEATSYAVFIEGLRQRNPDVRIIGLSATPYRMGHGLLTDPKRDGSPALFTDICYDVTGRAAFNRLIAEGFIAPLVPRRTKTEIDLSGVHIQGGEFNQNELQAAVDKQEITYKAVQEIMEEGADRNHWLIFATGVEHSEHVASMLNAEGIPARAVHSKLSEELQSQYENEFKTGKIRALVNNNLYTTGFNFKPVDLIGMLRPTESTSLWVQMLGRGTRPYDFRTERDKELAALCPFVKENCLVLDFAGNTRRLGQINDPRLPRRKGKGGGEAPVKVCLCCNTYNHTSARFCTNCNTPFPPARVKIEQVASSEALIADDNPVVEIFDVNQVEYARFLKKDMPPSIKVSYKCGFRVFSEWVCLEHLGLPRKKARDWWRARAGLEVEPPATTEEAIKVIESLRTPSHIRVWVNLKYPRVMDADFSGTGFNE